MVLLGCSYGITSSGTVADVLNSKLQVISDILVAINQGIQVGAMLSVQKCHYRDNTISFGILDN